MAAYSPPRPVPCEFCGQPRFTRGARVAGTVKWLPFPEPCPCPGARAKRDAERAEREAREAGERRERDFRRDQALLKRLIGDSGMGRRFLDRTFDTFVPTPGSEDALNAARGFAERFGREDAGKRNGLYVTGPAGVGKTHLAAAIANELIGRRTAVICMTMIDLLSRVKRSFGGDGPDEYDVVSAYAKAPLLIIDDMGKERPTEWTAAKIYEIVNARYENCMPVVVTTNYGDAELARRITPPGGDEWTAEATVDRLREMCEGVVITGESWRAR